MLGAHGEVRETHTLERLGTVGVDAFYEDVECPVAVYERFQGEMLQT